MGYCVRYWISTAGGPADEALLYVHGDLFVLENGRPKLTSGAALLTTGKLQRDAQLWSRIYRGPYIAVGRLGALGSSGNHLHDRKGLDEVRVVMAALDVLKDKHSFKRFHLVGQSGGGHTVAALLQKRTDIGCAVMASAAVSLKSAVRDRGRVIDQRIKAAYDPIDMVGSMRHQPGRRMIVLSDPRDRFVLFRSQREFVERVKKKGLPILHITASAEDKDFHGLVRLGHQVATDCAKGADDEALVTRYQAAPASVAHRQ